MNRWSHITLAVLMFLIWPPLASGATEIINLRYWAAPDHTRVVLDTDEEVQFTVEKSDQSVSLNLKHVVPAQTLPPEFVLNKPGIRKVVLSPLPGGHMQIEFFLAKGAETNIFKLKKVEDKPYRLVVDITLPEVEKENTQAREKVKVSRKDKIIVLDPGHGGEDPGARGRQGTNEKDVVLEIGKKLRDILNAGEGTRAFLTREGDYYVSFKKRLSMARELGADLFISIHADAAKNRKASGSSVYCLSNGAASSEAAKILARKENMADIIGGVLGEGKNSEESDPVILDMFQNNTINKSKIFGANILDRLCLVNDIKFSRVQEAPFRVLKLPEIPAVLIETAYISNPQEEKNLCDGAYQARIAETIAGSVREFFSLPAETASVASAGEGKSVAKVKGKVPAAAKLPPKAHTYKAKKGDTLQKIAALHDTDVSTLLKLNNMKLLDTLFVGKVLKVTPDPEPEEKEVPAAAKLPPKAHTYKAKKGDTLQKIAALHDTDVGTLLKLNNMKLLDTLFVGKVLKVTQDPEPEEKEVPTASRARGGKVPKAKATPLVHRVKKGETLGKVAKKYQTNIATLLKLNHLKLHEPLFVDRELKLPPPHP